MSEQSQRYAAPPAELEQIKTKIRRHPCVARVGLTIVEHHWALKVWVHEGSAPPLAEVEALSDGFPVVYAETSARLPVARPAYPKEGE